MGNSFSLFITLMIFLLCCLSGSHCKPSFNSDTRGIVSIVAADSLMHGVQQEGDDSQGAHVCHFGHTCHCSFDVPKETVFKISSFSFLSLDGKNLFYENPTIDGLVRPPIS